MVTACAGRDVREARGEGAAGRTSTPPQRSWPARPELDAAGRALPLPARHPAAINRDRTGANAGSGPKPGACKHVDRHRACTQARCLHTCQPAVVVHASSERRYRGLDSATWISATRHTPCRTGRAARPRLSCARGIKYQHKCLSAYPLPYNLHLRDSPLSLGLHWGACAALLRPRGGWAY